MCRPTPKDARVTPPGCFSSREPDARRPQSFAVAYHCRATHLYGARSPRHRLSPDYDYALSGSISYNRLQRARVSAADLDIEGGVRLGHLASRHSEGFERAQGLAPSLEPGGKVSWRAPLPSALRR